MNDNLADLSKAISFAQALLEEAQTAMITAQEPRDQIHSRLQHLVEERAAIAARRAGGERHDEDAGRLALIDMDSAGLATLLIEAEAITANATAKCTQAGLFYLRRLEALSTRARRYRSQRTGPDLARSSQSGSCIEGPRLAVARLRRVLADLRFSFIPFSLFACQLPGIWDQHARWPPSR